MKVAVIGSGSWGSAIASLLAGKGYNVWLWSWQEAESKRLAKDKENKEFLPGVALDKNITFSHIAKDCVENADLIVTASPSHAMRSTAKSIAPFVAEGQRIVNISKGLEEGTYFRMSQVIASEIPQAKIAVMSGPSHAEEVGRGMETLNVVASEDIETARFVQDTFMAPYFRVYTSEDVIGVELGGALKNVIALAAGVAAGLGCGDNALAALMTRGIAEIARLGIALGAERDTFAGLAGIGDLMVTCMSRHSRNRRCGVMLGQGMSLEEAKEKVHMVVEGVGACYVAYDLAKKQGVDMPITSCMYKILKGTLSAKDAAAELMGREKRAE